MDFLTVATVYLGGIAILSAIIVIVVALSMNTAVQQAGVNVAANKAYNDGVDAAVAANTTAGTVASNFTALPRPTAPTDAYSTEAETAAFTEGVDAAYTADANPSDYPRSETPYNATPIIVSGGFILALVAIAIIILGVYWVKLRTLWNNGTDSYVSIKEILKTYKVKGATKKSSPRELLASVARGE
jgi:hypothetical protein